MKSRPPLIRERPPPIARDWPVALSVILRELVLFSPAPTEALLLARELLLLEPLAIRRVSGKPPIREVPGCCAVGGENQFR